MSAGARLTVMRFAGIARPEATSAERTRSRDSVTALSPSPTILKTTLPGRICTCTSTGLASMPSNATVATLTTMTRPSCEAGCSQSSASAAAAQEQDKNILGDGLPPWTNARQSRAPAKPALHPCRFPVKRRANQGGTKWQEETGETRSVTATIIGAKAPATAPATKPTIITAAAAPMRAATGARIVVVDRAITAGILPGMSGATATVIAATATSSRTIRSPATAASITTNRIIRRPGDIAVIPAAPASGIVAATMAASAAALSGTATPTTAATGTITAAAGRAAAPAAKTAAFGIAPRTRSHPGSATTTPNDDDDKTITAAAGPAITRAPAIAFARI